jgi:CheY-like chemotaxis protein
VAGEALAVLLSGVALSSRNAESEVMSYRITVIEDNEPDVLLLQKALKRTGIEYILTVLIDGECACAYLDSIQKEPEIPDLILLDLNLPRIGGMEVAEHIRRREVLNNVPIVVWSSGSSVSQREALMHYGITKYIVKPTKYADFMDIGDSLKRILSSPGAAAGQ